ncbi:MAG TPA: sigma-70 family RNA polymerase sigma factor [Polyangiaceae bacterium LLY-WYZ-14_1]|nr:sigma-70 family RNA polymerase sigma factor [Polyangiaceae bacterium LLY-WYZ-14_1]
MIADVDPKDLVGGRGWRGLESKLRPFVAKRVREVDVDDVIQEVLLRVQRGLAALRDDQRLGPWIYQVARSAIADHGRARSRHPQARWDASEEAVVPEDLDDRDVEREVAGYVALFVAMLPSPYREALTLTELEGRTQKEAAEMVGTSLSGMKSRVQRGRAKLREALEDCCRFELDARRRVAGCEPRSDGKRPARCCR